MVNKKGGRIIITTSISPQAYDRYAQWKKGTRSRKVESALVMYDELLRKRKEINRERVDFERKIRTQSRTIQQMQIRIDALLMGLPDPGMEGRF